MTLYRRHFISLVSETLAGGKPGSACFRGRAQECRAGGAQEPSPPFQKATSEGNRTCSPSMHPHHTPPPSSCRLRERAVRGTLAHYTPLGSATGSEATCKRKTWGHLLKSIQKFEMITAAITPMWSLPEHWGPLGQPSPQPRGPGRGPGAEQGAPSRPSHPEQKPRVTVLRPLLKDDHPVLPIPSPEAAL